MPIGGHPPRTTVAAYAHGCLKGDPMPRFTERDGKTPELVVSGTQVQFSAMALLSAGSVIWVFFQHLLFSQ